MRLFGETIALFFGEKLAPILLERLDAQIQAALYALVPAGHGCGRVADSIIVIINIINIITIIGASANYSLPHSLLLVLRIISCLHSLLLTAGENTSHSLLLVLRIFS